MSKSVVVGITQRVDKADTHNEWRDALDQRLIDWVIEAGFIPLPIPNSLVDLSGSIDEQPILDDWIKMLGVGAVLLSGGNNIGDIPHRDATENYLLSWAEKNRKPVLGVCRGMQMMGVYAGGKLIKVNGHVRVRHQLKVIDRDKKILPEVVNSYHNQALQECPNTFKVLAKSADGSLEAIVHNDLPWEAWMWHPEREKEFKQIDLDRFKILVKNGK